MSEKAYRDIVQGRLACHFGITTARDGTLDSIANAVIAEYERREFEIVYGVKCDDGKWVDKFSSPSGYTAPYASSPDLRGTWSHEEAKSLAVRTGGTVVRIRRRRKP